MKIFINFDSIDENLKTVSFTNGRISGININEWKKVLLGLVLSAILGFAFGYIITKIIEKI